MWLHYLYSVWKYVLQYQTSYWTDSNAQSSCCQLTYYNHSGITSNKICRRHHLLHHQLAINGEAMAMTKGWHKRGEKKIQQAHNTIWQEKIYDTHTTDKQLEAVISPPSCSAPVHVHCMYYQSLKIWTNFMQQKHNLLNQSCKMYVNSYVTQNVTKTLNGANRQTSA